MDPKFIHKRSPITLDFLQGIAVDPESLAKYDQVRLKPSWTADFVGKDVMQEVMNLLNQRPICRGRCIPSGSLMRDVRLKKPGWGDLDIVCIVNEDFQGHPIESFEQFEKTRYGASKKIKEWLERKLATHFVHPTRSEVKEYWPGKGLMWREMLRER